MTAEQFDDVRRIMKWAAKMSFELYSDTKDKGEPESVHLPHYMRMGTAEHLLEKVFDS
jgi:hypothetical protein